MSEPQKKPYESPWDKFVRENDKKLALVEKYGHGWHTIQFIKFTTTTASP